MAKLTVRAIEAAKPKDKAYKLMDGNGLQLRIATDGTKTWLVRYSINNKERQYRLPKPYRDRGGDGFYSLQEARDEAAKIRAMARQGNDYPIQQEEERQAHAKRLDEEKKAAASDKKRQLIENLTVNDLFEVWLADGVLRKDGNAELRRSFTKDVLPEIGKLEIRSLTEHDLRKLLRKMVERGVNRLAVIAFNNLRQMFLWAEKRQPWRMLLSEGNPVQLIDIEKIVSPDYDLNNERTRKLSADEIRELHQKFISMHAEYDDAPNRRSAARPVAQTTELAIWIMLSTMCRVGELSMARWEHVDFESGVWFIPRKNTKGSQADFAVYMSPFAMQQFRVLHLITGQTEWCFPAKNKAGHICVKSISKQVGDRQVMFKKNKDGNARKVMKNRSKDENALVLSEGKNGDWTPHDLRRTGSTMMQGLGINLVIIDRCQNHVLPGSKVRRHYFLHEYAEEKREAWRLLGASLELMTFPEESNS